MSELEADRDIADPVADGRWSAERSEPRNPAEHRYDDGSSSPDAGTIDEAGVAMQDDAVYSIRDSSLPHSDYVTVEGEPPALDVAQRVGTHEVQGENSLGYEGTCGLASMSEMVGDQLGERVTENDIVHYASEHSLCATPETGVPPEYQGGTTISERDQLLREIKGLDVELVQGVELSELAAKVEADDGVLASVKAGEYSDDPATAAAAQAEPGTDHVVWVVGVERDSADDLTGFIVNDTGRTDGAGLRLDNEQMARAWQSRGASLNIARRSNR